MSVETPAGDPHVHAPRGIPDGPAQTQGAPTRGLGLLVPGLLAALAFGVATPAQKVVFEGVSPFVASGWLYLASGLALTVFLAVVRPRPERRVGRRDLRVMLASVLVGGTVAPVVFLIGLSHTSASTSSLLLSVELPMTIAIAVLLFGERLDRWRLLGAALVTVGGALVVKAEEGEGGSFLGPLLIACACLGWAFDSNLMRFLSHRSPLDVARWKGIGGGVTGFTLAGVTSAEWPQPTVSLVLGGAAVGVVAYGLSLAGYVASVARLGAARTGMLFGTAPLFGLAVSAAFLGESIGLDHLLPAGLMMLGVLLLGVERPAPLAPPAPPASPPSDRPPSA